MKAELQSYLETRYPFLAVTSHEEERVLSILGELARAQGVPLVPVSVAAIMRAEPEATPLRGLERIAQHEAPAIFALVDLHAWLGQPLVDRGLKDLRGALEQRRQSVVLVAPALDTPAALESELVRFELPLPSPYELAKALSAECKRTGTALSQDAGARAVRAVQGLTLLAARRAFRRALAEGGPLQRGDIGDLVREKRRVLRQTDLLEFVDAPPSMAQIGGLKALKEWLVEREKAFSQKAREFGLPTPKGLLLVGVQGCGKSLTAKAIAQQWNLPLARLEFGALFTHSRSPEENLRRVLQLSEALSPVVLWIDEIDKAFASVGSEDAGSEALTRVFASFITWLQEKTQAVFVVATANSVDHLPAELLRKGRFDEIFFVDLPTSEERAQILAIHLQAHGRDPKTFDVAGVAQRAEHFNGAEIRQIVIDGLYRAFDKGRDLNDEDLVVALEGTVPLYRTFEERIKHLREWAKARARRASPDTSLKDLWKSARR